MRGYARWQGHRVGVKCILRYTVILVLGALAKHLTESSVCSIVMFTHYDICICYIYPIHTHTHTHTYIYTHTFTYFLCDM